MPESPARITKEMVERLRERINENFNIFEEDNETIDLEKAQLKVAYNMGRVFTNYNGILMLERQILATLERNLDLAEAKAYDNIKMTKIKYDLDTAGMKLMVKGHEEVRPVRLEVENQKSYITFLEETLGQLKFFANKVDTIIKCKEIQLRCGA